MPNYQTSKIYKIVSDNSDKIYVGSTTQTLCKRFATHSAKFKGFLEGKYHFITSFSVLQEGNCSIVLLEGFPCNNKDELFKKEREYIEKIDCVNKFKPGRSREEWRKDYYENHRETEREQQKAYREANREKIALQRKAYREANREKIALQKKAYWESKKRASVLN